MRIVSLSKKTLKGAINLVERCFPNEDDNSPDDPRIWLPASLLSKKEFSSKFKEETLVKYWVLQSNRKIIGITGIYELKKDPEALWLSWFCVDRKNRGKGIGEKLIRYAIEKARKKKKKFFRLYTSNDYNEEPAQRLYEKLGLKIVRKERSKDDIYFYREIRL